MDVKGKCVGVENYFIYLLYWTQRYRLQGLVQWGWCKRETKSQPRKPGSPRGGINPPAC